jgi:ferredoxin
MGKVAYVNKDDCTSCNQCADNLPKYFQMDENDTSETHLNGQNINNVEIPEEETKVVQKEMDECPGECILWKK